MTVGKQKRNTSGLMPPWTSEDNPGKRGAHRPKGSLSLKTRALLRGNEYVELPNGRKERRIDLGVLGQLKGMAKGDARCAKFISDLVDGTHAQKLELSGKVDGDVTIKVSVADAAGKPMDI